MNNRFPFHFLVILICCSLLCVVVQVTSFVPSSISSVPVPVSAHHLYQKIKLLQGQYQAKKQIRTTTRAKTKRNGHGENDEKDSSTITQTQKLYPNLSIIGICGSIGSGKSFTSKLLVSKLNSLLHPQKTKTKHDDIKDDDYENDADLIAFHIDTDSLAHGVYAPGSTALQEIESEFGSSVIHDEEDGSQTVNRKALGAIVFSDDEQMSKLERIVWPHVKTLLLQRLDEISSTSTTTHKIVVVEAAVLLDANWDSNNLFDAIWIIQSSPKVSVERLTTFRNMEKWDALKRIEAQEKRRGIGNVDDEVENGNVTCVIMNDGNCSDALWGVLCEKLVDIDSWKDGRCLNDEKLIDVLSCGQ